MTFQQIIRRNFRKICLPNICTTSKPKSMSRLFLLKKLKIEKYSENENPKKSENKKLISRFWIVRKSGFEKTIICFMFVFGFLEN